MSKNNHRCPKKTVTQTYILGFLFVIMIIPWIGLNETNNLEGQTHILPPISSTPSSNNRGFAASPCQVIHTTISDGPDIITLHVQNVSVEDKNLIGATGFENGDVLNTSIVVIHRFSVIDTSNGNEEIISGDFDFDEDEKSWSKEISTEEIPKGNMYAIKTNFKISM